MADRIGQTKNALKLPFAAPKNDKEHAANARWMETWGNKLPVVQPTAGSVATWQDEFTGVSVTHGWEMELPAGIYSLLVDAESEGLWVPGTTEPAVMTLGVDIGGQAIAFRPAPDVPWEIDASIPLTMPPHDMFGDTVTGSIHFMNESDGAAHANTWKLYIRAIGWALG